ncbi:MAG TPA: hypothetical protein VIP77_21315 [Jiangellaceae bacterium]
MTAEVNHVALAQDELRAVRATMSGAVQAVGEAVTAWLGHSRRMVAAIRPFPAYTQRMHAQLTGFEGATDALADDIDAWSASGSDIATGAATWNLNAKRSLHELLEFIAARDAFAETLGPWKDGVDLVADDLGAWKDAPAAVTASLDEMRAVATRLAQLDPAVTGGLPRAVSAVVTETTGEARAITTRTGRARARTRMFGLRVKNSQNRMAAVRRTGVSGVDDLAEAIAAMDQFSADAAELTRIADEFQRTTDAMKALVAELDTPIGDVADMATEMATTITSASATVESEQNLLIESADAARAQIEEKRRRLDYLHRTGTRAGRVMDNVLDAGDALSAEVVRRADETFRRVVAKIPARWITWADHAGDVLLEHADVLRFEADAQLQRAASRLPTVLFFPLSRQHLVYRTITDDLGVWNDEK